jgi:hypothetical protein
MPMLDFAEATLLGMQANETRNNSYSTIVLAKKPTLYWQMAERRGSRVATNHGSTGVGMCGYYATGVTHEQPGAVRNDSFQRAVGFDAELKTRVDTKFSPRTVPQRRSAPFSIELWARVGGAMGTNRIAVMSGRYALSAMREDHWGFTIFDGSVDATVNGPVVTKGEWVHLVGTYDGTMARFYINRKLEGDMELGPEISRRSQEANDAREQQLKDLEDAEKSARDSARKQTETQAAQFFKTPEGQERVKRAALKLIEHSEFKLKLDANAAAKGLKRLGKKEAQLQARKDYKTELYMKNVQAVAEEFRRLRQDILDRKTKEAEEARDRSTKPLRVGAACASKRSKSGRSFFNGDLCHFAVYEACLTPDEVREHYASGITPRSAEAERLYALSSEKFERALMFAPNDRHILSRYAAALCSYLLFDDGVGDSDLSGSAMKRAKRKVGEAIDMFRQNEIADGLAELLRRLPADDTFGDLACVC